MKTLLTKISNNWPQIATFFTTCSLLLWLWGCPSSVPSLIENGKNVTRPELQIELNTIVATAQVRMANLEQQDQLRRVIFQNALLIVDGNGFNPLGLLSGVAALYGITAATKNTVSAIKKKPPPT